MFFVRIAGTEQLKESKNAMMETFRMGMDAQKRVRLSLDGLVQEQEQLHLVLEPALTAF